MTSATARRAYHILALLVVGVLTASTAGLIAAIALISRKPRQ